MPFSYKKHIFLPLFWNERTRTKIIKPHSRNITVTVDSLGPVGPRRTYNSKDGGVCCLACDPINRVITSVTYSMAWIEGLEPSSLYSVASASSFASMMTFQLAYFQHKGLVALRNILAYIQHKMASKAGVEPTSLPLISGRSFFWAIWIYGAAGRDLTSISYLKRIEH